MWFSIIMLMWVSISLVVFGYLRLRMKRVVKYPKRQHPLAYDPDDYTADPISVSPRL